MIGLVLVLILIGVALYLLPMDEKIRNLIIVIVVIATLLYLLNGFGYLPSNFSKWRG